MRIDPAPTLQQLQSALAESIFGYGDDRPPAAEIPLWLDVPDSVDRGERLAIYRNGYPARLHEALRDTFPAIAHIVGEPGFSHLTDRYRRSVPIRSDNLNAVGDHLPSYLHRDPLTATLPFLTDLALLEHAVRKAFDAFEAAPLDPELLHSQSNVDWAGAILRFQPGTAIVRSPWPILDLWQARNADRKRIDIALIDRPQSVAVMRNGLDVHCEVLPSTQATLLETLLRGVPLGAAIEAAAAMDDGSLQPECWFAEWMNAGRIVAVDTAPPHSNAA